MPGLVWILILIECIIVLRGACSLYTARKKNKASSDKNLSIIIPVKGWDLSLPDLIKNLLIQHYQASFEVILIADKDNPHLSQLPQSSNLILLYMDPLQKGWQDKIERLYQGVKVAQYETLLFLDSDVTVDPHYLTHRLEAHKGTLSFSIPLYTRPQSSSSYFLASFTNFLNFTIYRAGFSLCNLTTAIGPSMLFTAKKSTILQALEKNKEELADDHAMGYWFQTNGYHVHCSEEPVYVTTDPDVGWSQHIHQILRWLSLPRTVFHLITRHTLCMVVCSSILNAIGGLFLFLGIFLHTTPYGFSLIAGGSLFIITETLLLLCIERGATRRISPPFPWHHLLYTPLVLIGLLPLSLLSLTKRSVTWRGKEIFIKYLQ